jgi:hypothetical protein
MYQTLLDGKMDVVIWDMMEVRLECRLSNSALGVVDPATLFNCVEKVY